MNYPRTSIKLQRPLSRQTERWTRTLHEDIAWQWQPYEGVTHRIYIPAGVEYNPSSPGIAHPIVPVSRMEIASAVHDPLYILQGQTDLMLERVRALVMYKAQDGSWKKVPQVSRAYTDLLFREMMLNLGVKPWRAELAYAGARSPVGWWHWQEEDERRPALEETIRQNI